MEIIPSTAPSSLKLAMLLLTLTAVLLPVAVLGGPVNVEWDILKTMEGTPELGQGYSIDTGALHSTCLVTANGTMSDYSYGYNYFVTNLVNDDQNSTQNLIESTISKTMSYGRAKEVCEQSASYNNGVVSKSMPKRYNAMATMKVDRVSSCINEDNIRLTRDAMQLLHNEDYLKFFVACGPNFIRSIHRVHEVTAIFTFDSIDQNSAAGFVEALNTFIHGMVNPPEVEDNDQVEGDPKKDTKTASYSKLKNTAKNQNDEGEDDDGQGKIPEKRQFIIPSGSGDYARILETLSIEILGYGLGLNVVGQEILVTTNLEKFGKIMKIAHDSMVHKPSYSSFSSMHEQNDEHHRHNDRGSKPMATPEELGTVQQMEVAPWVDNSEFSRITGIKTSVMKLPVSNAQVESSIIVEGEPACRRPQMVLDSYAKCCDEQDIVTYNVAVVDKNDQEIYVERMRCEPFKRVPPTVLSKNMHTNAEFVSRLNAALNDKIRLTSTLGGCLSELQSYPSSLDNYYLREANIDEEQNFHTDLLLTTKIMKAALDPTGDMDIMDMIEAENDEYVEMFYQPCIDALHGMHQGLDSNTDSRYFMAQPWYEHSECNKHSCFGPTKAWDRFTGGDCVEGILGRRSIMSALPADDDLYCAISVDDTSGNEVCTKDKKVNTMRQMDQCRNALSARITDQLQSPVSFSYLIDQLCMPKVAMDLTPESDAEMLERLDDTWAACAYYP